MMQDHNRSRESRLMTLRLLVSLSRSQIELLSALDGLDGRKYFSLLDELAKELTPQNVETHTHQ